MSNGWILVGSVVLAALGAWPLASAPDAISPEAEIVAEREPLAEGRERVTLTAVYTGTGTGLRYLFSTVKDGSTGRSESVQRGEVERGNMLATSSVEIGANDRISAHLRVLKGDRVVEEVRWERAGL